MREYLMREYLMKLLMLGLFGKRDLKEILLLNG